MTSLRFHTGYGNPPAYSGFWAPGISRGGYLDNRSIIRVRSGQYYWMTGFPENLLPTACEGRGELFSSIAYASVLVKDEEGNWYEKSSGEKYFCDKSRFAFAERSSKLHILYDDTIYRIKYERASRTEIDMYRSWIG